MQTMERVIFQDLSNQIATITADRAAWRARALMAEKQLAELTGDASDDENLEVSNE